MNYWRYDKGDAPPSILHSNLVHDTSTRMLALPLVGEVRSKKEQRIMRYILVLLLLRSEECEPQQPSEPAVRTTAAQ